MTQDSALPVDRAESDRIVDYRDRFDLSRRRYLVLGGGQGMGGRPPMHSLSSAPG